MQILCVVLQKKLQLLGDFPQSSFMSPGPNNPVRSTPLTRTNDGRVVKHVRVHIHHVCADKGLDK